MKILLIGSNGQLGQEVKALAPSDISGIKYQFITLTRNELNLEDSIACEKIIKDEKPDWLINCAAYTNVDEAEKEKGKAQLINGIAPKVFSKELKKFSGKLVHISTDFVFSGKQGFPYTTDQKLEPINEYGRSKALGEKAVLKYLSYSKNGFIIRTSWLVSAVGKNFVNTMIRLLNERSELNVVSDQIGCITSTHSLALAIWNLIKIREENFNCPLIFHISDSGAASWYDIAMAIYEMGSKIGLINNDVKIKPIKSKYYPSPAKRPSYSLLECDDSKNFLKLDSIYWRESLEKILLKLSNNK